MEAHQFLSVMAQRPSFKSLVQNDRQRAGRGLVCFLQALEGATITVELFNDDVICGGGEEGGGAGVCGG